MHRLAPGRPPGPPSDPVRVAVRPVWIRGPSRLSVPEASESSSAMVGYNSIGVGHMTSHQRPGRDLHADRQHDRLTSCSWTTRAFAGLRLRCAAFCVARELTPRGPTMRPARVARAPSVLETDRLAVTARPQGPRAGVEPASRGPQPRVLPLDDRGHVLRRPESHRRPGLMGPGCCGYTTPQWRDRNRPRKPLDGFEPSEDPFTRRGPNPYWRQRRPRVERIRGEPRLP